MGGIMKSHTTPYHPMGNGVTERFNRTLGSMLRSLPPRVKQKWPQMIQSMTFVYNCTAHETTGFAPFYLMFGRVPRLPVDLIFKSVLRDDTVCDYNAYVKSLMNDLHSAMVLAQEHSAAEQRHQSRQYNKRVRGLPLSVGDRVLLANKSARGKRKLSDKWESTVFEVVASKPGLNLYKIRDSSGRERTVHRNLLLQVNFLPLDPSLDEQCSVSSVAAPGKPDTSSSERGTDTLGPLIPPCVCESSEVRTASWVQAQSSCESEDLPSPEGMCSASLGWAGAGAPSLPSIESHSHQGDLHDLQDRGLGHRVTTRLGRIIKPVCRLIESMAQIESVFGNQKSPIRTV
ncbi:uncharacterized protein LOC114135710 [Xiphophorus couchianus]|uniref:uncharacterized protein LOC114135710 n=1 Tax=Xiphophorus couchianus TaxID=32473 RepID=UPI001016D522|nr:uncharacterized protein LOC114135710 [Xiphophorus couchianus]